MPSPTQPQRWLALWLPLLPTDRVQRKSATPSDRPLVFYNKSGNAFALTACDARALKLGLHPGMPLSDARAIFPALDARETDEGADARLLDRIAAWCERFTPVVVLDPPHGLFLDVTGCTHLHGGEAEMLAALQTSLTAQGFANRAALAPTPGAAWALARHRSGAVIGHAETPAALASLPVTALRLEPEAAALLARLGLKHIGQIVEAPRAAFTARAGKHAMQQLDQAFGRAPETLSPRRPPPPLFSHRRLLEPVITLQALLHVTEDLCADLCAKLNDSGMGVRLLMLSFYGVDDRARRLKLGLSLTERAPKALLRLFRERMEREAERFNAEFGFEAARLDALEVAPWTLRPTDLAPASSRYDAEAEARLIDRLKARLGGERVGKLCIRNVHAPERTQGWNDDKTLSLAPCEDGVMRRPLTLLARAQPIEAVASVPDGPPMRFRWRHVLRTVTRAEGPERIAPNWLRAGDERTRDYYRVEDEEGRRYWIYRDGFYGGDHNPRWFMHGLFA